MIRLVQPAPALLRVLLVSALVLAACELDPTGTGGGVTGVTVTASSTEVVSGTSLQLTATVTPSTAPQTVTWSSSDNVRATVDPTGLVTGLSSGPVTITATSTANPSRSGSIGLAVLRCPRLTANDVANGGILVDANCYEVQGALTVSDGTLTVQPGVEVEFGSNGSLTIATNGRLNAVGTPAQPIVFTSTDPVGSWRGIRFTNSRSTDNVLRFVTIRNGGSAAWTGDAHTRTALFLEGNTLIDIQHSTIDGSGGQGVLIQAQVESTFEHNWIHTTVIPIWAHPNAVHQIAPSTVFGSQGETNVEDIVRVGFDNNDAVTTDQTWRNLDAPYEIQDRMFVEANLTIEKGTIIEFRQDASMIVEPTGSLNAVGEPGAGGLITFTNAGRINASLPNFWKGIQILSASPNNRFDHVVFENGGSQQWTGDTDSRATVYLEGNSRAVFSNSSFEGSGLYGLWVPAEGNIDGFEGNVFRDNARAMIVHPNRAGSIAASNTFAGTGENRVRVTFNNNDEVSTAQTWHNFGAPFYITDRTWVAAPLTIAVGTVVEFAQNASLRIRDGGSLQAVGVVDDPIVFRGGQDVAGYWFGIEYNAVSADNVLEHVVFRNAGAGQWYGGGNAAASLYVATEGSASLRNVRFQLTGGYAAIRRFGGSLSCQDVDHGGFRFLIWHGLTPTEQDTCS